MSVLEDSVRSARDSRGANLRTAELIASDDERSRCSHGRTGGTVAASALAPGYHAGVGAIAIAIDEKVADCTGDGDVAPVGCVACTGHWFMG